MNAQKEIQELRNEVEQLKLASAAVAADLRALYEILDRTFRSMDASVDWSRAKASWAERVNTDSAAKAATKGE
jgi:hypothetical protein